MFAIRFFDASFLTRSKTMVTRRSPITSRTSRSSLGKAFVNAALTPPVITNNGSPERSLIQ